MHCIEIIYLIQNSASQSHIPLVIGLFCHITDLVQAIETEWERKAHWIQNYFPISLQRLLLKGSESN